MDVEGGIQDINLVQKAIVAPFQALKGLEGVLVGVINRLLWYIYLLT